MRFTRSFSCLLLPLLCLASSAWAQEKNNENLHILRPIIHAEQDRAELCLEADHTLDDSDRARNAIVLRLESDGKKMAVSQQGLNITATTLCLPSLEHRRSYRLTLSGLKGSDGEKLAEPYHFSFTVPDRKASLAFLSDLYSGGMMRWQNNDPVLHGINVDHAKIELYRISTLPLMLDAWRQHKQTTLAPSESAYFARDKGQLVWQGELALDDTPNKVIEQKVPLHDAVQNITPGFYLVVASAILPKGQAGKNDLVPLAAAWLLRSNLKIHALRDKDGYYALADKADASGLYPNAHVLLEDDHQQTLVEGKIDGDGATYLALGNDKLNRAVTLAGLADNGDVDFADINPNPKMHMLLPDIDASLEIDKDFYAPGATANVILTARNAQGQPIPMADSHLQILRADRSLYTTLPVPKDKSGIAHLALPVPVGNGLWSLQWQQNDGRNLAEIPLHITANEDAPHLEASVDHPMIGDNGGLTLNLTGITAAGKPAPLIAGQVSVTWITPDTLFPGWAGYHFGGAESSKATQPQTVSFLTDAKGQAQLHLNVTPPGDSTALRAAFVSVQSDPAAGVANPAPLVIPVKPADVIVGIKPFAEDGRFAENSLARFDVIALDGDGKRRDAEGLSYQIFEEGRSFDWYQDTGRWNYKPLEQTRRVGGGTLTLKADANNHIDWPVNAGNYQLVIRNAADKIMAQATFSAGWVSNATDALKPAPLNLTASKTTLHAGEEFKVRYKLEQASVVSAVIADDHIRKIIHLTQAAGDNSFSFTPDGSMHNRLVISVNVRTSSPDGTILPLAGQITLPFAHSEISAASNTVTETTAVPPFAIRGAEIPVLKLDDQIGFTVTLENNGSTAGAYHYVFTAVPGLKISNGGSGTVTLAPQQTRDIDVTLNAMQTGSKELKLEVSGPRNFRQNANWNFAIVRDDAGFKSAVAQEIAPRQSWSRPVSAKSLDKNHSVESGLILLAPIPLFDLPSLLTTRMHMHGFTTAEIADEMNFLKLWHDTLLQMGLAPEQKIVARQHRLLLRLLARQKPDGSFPFMPDGEADITSTAAAVAALGASDQDLAKTGTEQAANWLHKRLDNSWFDEQERSERAAAYAALASADRTDTANLHYFSDTSADKPLSALAAAQLAFAFAKAKDQDKAIFWLNAIKAPKEGADIPLSLLPLLADNIFFDEHKLLPALEHIANAKPTDLTAITAFLRTLWFVQNRADVWRVTVNNRDQNIRNILVLSLPEKTTAVTIRNPNDRPLYMTEIQESKLPASGDPVLIRHIYRTNGSEIAENDSLDRGENYIITTEGTWPVQKTGNDDDGLLVRDPVGPALTPLSCSMTTDLETSDALIWIKNLQLAPAAVCEKSGSTIEAFLTRTSNSAKTWRIGYVARAERSGVFKLNPVQIRLQSAEYEPATSAAILKDDSARQGASQKLRVKE